MELKQIKFDKIQTIENYASTLLMATISLASMINIEREACSSGILEEDEIEYSHKIQLEYMRIFNCLRKQMESVLERSPMNEEQILQDIRKNYE